MTLGQFPVPAAASVSFSEKKVGPSHAHVEVPGGVIWVESSLLGPGSTRLLLGPVLRR